MEVQIHI